MVPDPLTRRQVLGIAGAAGISGIGVTGYVTDNPVHRSTVKQFDERRLDSTPDPGTFWYSEYRSGSDLPAANVTHLTGVQYRGRRGAREPPHDDRWFDVFGVVIGRRSTLLGTGPLVGPRFLGVRGVGSSVTTAWDGGDVPYIRGGPLRTAETVADALPLQRTQLDDEGAIQRLVEQRQFPGANEARNRERLRADIQLSGALLDRYDGEHDGRLTRAGLLYGLHGTGAGASKGTPKYENRGELYSWRPGTVLAHVVRYRGLWVTPDDGRCRVKIAQGVPRPSLLGQPRIESGLVIDFPK